MQEDSDPEKIRPGLKHIIEIQFEWIHQLIATFIESRKPPDQMYIHTAWPYSLLIPPQLICIMKCIWGAELINIIYAGNEQ